MARRYSPELLGPTRVKIPSRLPDFELPLKDIEEGLGSSSLFRARRGASEVLRGLCIAYRIPPLKLSVFDRPRPSIGGRRYAGELHGDYTPPGRIRVWARTAKRGQRVAFLTFLDTLLHEFVHHYDLTYLKLPDTVHSQHFYKRLGSIRRMVRPQGAARTSRDAFSHELSFAPIQEALQEDPSPSPAAPEPAPRPSRGRKPPSPQLTLPF